MADPLSGLPPHLHSVLQGSGADLNRPSSAPGFGQSSSSSFDVGSQQRRLNPRLAVRTPDVPVGRGGPNGIEFDRAPTPPPGGSPRLQEQSFGGDAQSDIFGAYRGGDISSVGDAKSDILKPDPPSTTNQPEWSSSLMPASSSDGSFPRSPSPAQGGYVGNQGSPRTPPPTQQQPNFDAYYAAIAASQASGGPFNPAAAAAAAAALAVAPNAQQGNAQLVAAMMNL